MESRSAGVAPPIASCGFKNYRAILDVIGALQAKDFGVQKLQLPCIVVTGHESCGKSSLLEAISGVRLPTGREVTTRCPIQLLMKRGPAASGPKYLVKWTPAVSAQTAKVMPDPVEAEPQSETELKDCLIVAMKDVTGTDKSINDGLIEVTVSAPHVPDLILVDLPGLISTASTSQSPDLPQKVEALVEKHLQGKHKIILCVMEAGASVSAHGKALTLARKHDPEQKRTFGVFTKVDARLTGDSPRDHVEYAMQNHPLKVMGQEGYHAVRLRAESERHDSLEESRHREAAFFADDLAASHAPYPCSTGVESLTRRLETLLEALLGEALGPVQQKVEEHTMLLTSQIRQLDDRSAVAQVALARLRFGVAESGRRINQLCLGHTGTIDDKARWIHPQFEQLGNSFQTLLIGEGDKRLPDWFFGEECRDLLKTAMASRSGQDLNGLLEHPEHARVVFKEEVWSRLVGSGPESPITAMLKDMHKAVEVAISDILKDKWQTETGQEFQLPKEAQAWVKQQISEKILHANQEAAAEHLRVWRDAQLGTLWNFNKRLPLITTLLKEVMYNISEQHQAEQRAFSDTEAGSQQEKTANGDASAPSKATTDTAGAKARKAAVSVVMPVLSIFFPVPDLSVPVAVLTEYLYQKIKQLVINHPRKQLKPGAQTLMDEEREFAMARLQLTVAAHSMLMLEQWSQQVPAAIKHFMITKVGNAAGLELYHSLGCDTLSAPRALHLMGIGSEAEQRFSQQHLETELSVWTGYKDTLKRLQDNMVSLTRQTSPEE